MKNYFTDCELLKIIDLIDDRIEYLEICDLPDDYCKRKQEQFSELRQKVSNLL